MGRKGLARRYLGSVVILQGAAGSLCHGFRSLPGTEHSQHSSLPTNTQEIPTPPLYGLLSMAGKSSLEICHLVPRGKAEEASLGRRLKGGHWLFGRKSPSWEFAPGREASGGRLSAGLEALHGALGPIHPRVTLALPSLPPR